jgi:type VI secretion system protein ImpG
VPVQGTSCRFTTVYPVELHPLALLDASYSQPPGRPAMIILHMELTGMRLVDWQPETVRLFLSGEYGRAADLYLLLTRYLRRIIIEAEDGSTPAVLDPSHLKPVGFDSGKGLFTASVRGAVSHHCVREYSILPEKFLFLDLHGWKNWRDRGEEGRFEVRFELEKSPFTLDKVTKEDFTLFAAPAVNVFQHKARPILLVDEEAEYPVIPVGSNPTHYEVYSIEKVAGILEVTSEKVAFQSYGSNSVSNPVYHEMRNESLHGYDTSLSVKLPHNKKKGVQFTISSLSVELLCTNGLLAENLRVGDVCEEVDKSPSYATFTNCIPVTGPLFDTLGENRLWRLFGMQFINLKLLTTESLRSILKLIFVSAGQDRRTVVRNERYVEGIQGLTIEACDRIVRQIMKRGWKIRIMLDPECYCSPGDRYLFGAMLDHFLRGFVSEAYFSRTIIEDVRGGIDYELPTKMGRRALV